MLEALGLIIAGVCIASAAMAVGIGGGILWTPLLILAYGLSPQESVATSLMIQVVGMGSGTLAYMKAKLTQIRLSLIFFAVALPGVIIGGYLSVRLSQDMVQMMLGIMAMTVAVLFVAGQDQFVDTGTSAESDRRKVRRLLPIPAFFGFMMGTLSVGIGEWLVPALRQRLNLDMRQAIATVIPVMFLLAICASAVHWSQTDGMRLNYFAYGAIGTFVGGQIGPRISQRIDERMLKQSFIYLMTLIGIHMIFQAI